MAAYYDNDDQLDQSYSYDEEEMLIYNKDLWNGADDYSGTDQQELTDSAGTNGNGNSGRDPKRKKMPIALILIGAAILVAVMAAVLLLTRGRAGDDLQPDPSGTSGSASSQIQDQTTPTAGAEATQPDYSLTLNTRRLSLFVDGTTQLTASGVPADARLEWNSSDMSVAMVEEGLVTAKSAGTAVITVRWTNNGETQETSVEVLVETMGVTLDNLQVEEFFVGQSMTINAATSPANQKLTWTSSNENVAVVNANGVVTAVGSGTAIITAGFGEYYQNCSVTVTEPGITLSKTVSNLYLGDSTIVEAEVLPKDAAVKWSSEDNSIATVDDEGKITAVSEGATTITARMTFEGKVYETECAVTVTKPGITLSEESISLSPGASAELKATIKPSGCTVTWSSSNKSVATVTNGKVTAKAGGTATITAQFTYKNKTYEAACVVKVATVKRIAVATMPEKTTYAPGEALNTTGLTLTATYDDNSTKTITSGFTCSAITATPNGAPVTQTITVTYQGCTTTFEVTVLDPVSTVTNKKTTVVIELQDRNVTYTGEWQNGAPNGYGTAVCNDSGTHKKYTGNFTDGEADGYGELEYSDGAVYKGSFYQGRRQGAGVLTCANGDVYDGQWMGSYFEGTVSYTNGDVYVGTCQEFEQGDFYRNGEGTMTYTSGDVYEGEWYLDEYDGYGTYTFADGSYYAGDWDEGVPHGQGYMYAEGYSYDGDFVDGEMHGYGVYTTPDGDRYEGEFQYGEITGYGVAYFANGDVYEGEWYEGSFHGQGKMTYADGTVEEGQWENGEFQG